MLDNALRTVIKYDMLQNGDTVVVGVSGGADSVALLFFLCEIKDRFGISIHAVHVNHHLRGEDADSDQHFVEDFCQSRSIPYTVFEFNVEEYAKNNGLTSEEAGRILRYQVFEETANKYASPKIATAHHLNDNVETVLHNILRGSGTTGLSGIHSKRGKYIRPLIETERTEIEEYLNSENISWCTDKTNNEAIYTRNKIRLELLPYLRENFNSSVDSALNRLSELCREDDDYLRISTDRIFNSICHQTASNGVILTRNEFNSLHIAMKRRLLRCILENMNIPLKDVHMAHIDDCIRLIAQSQSGAAMKISSCNVRAEQSGIRFYLQSDEIPDYSYTISEDQSVYIAETGQTVTCESVDSYQKHDKNTAYICADGTSGIFEVRNRRNGDKIRPYGLNGTKKVKDIFIDNKIDVCTRNKIPIIVYNNEVVWISGVCLSEKYKITKNSKKLLKFVLK